MKYYIILIIATAIALTPWLTNQQSTQESIENEKKPRITVKHSPLKKSLAENYKSVVLEETQKVLANEPISTPSPDEDYRNAANEHLNANTNANQEQYLPTEVQRLRRQEINQERKEYKKIVLMRLANRLGNSRKNNRVGRLTPQVNLTTDSNNLESEISDSLNVEQIRSETKIDAEDTVFNFSSFSQIPIKVQTRTETGEAIPFASFTLENNNGSILLEAHTDKNGLFTESLKCYKNTKVYIRFQSTGMSNERTLITPTGEQK